MVIAGAPTAATLAMAERACDFVFQGICQDEIAVTRLLVQTFPTQIARAFRMIYRSDHSDDVLDDIEYWMLDAYDCSGILSGMAAKWILTWACLNNRPSLVDHLLDMDCVLKQLDSGMWENLTTTAIRQRYDRVARALVTSFEDVFGFPLNGSTAAHLFCTALIAENPALATTILKKFPDINLQWREDPGLGPASPLMLAIIHRNVGVTRRLLVKRGVEQALAESSAVYLCEAICRAQNAPTADCQRHARRNFKMLCKHAAVSVNDGHGAALRLACNVGDCFAAETLLKHPGIDVNVCDGEPLICACKAQALGIVELLLKRADLDINARNGDALIYAIRTENPDLIELFFDMRGDKLAVNCQRGAPLLLAVQLSAIDIVEMLLAHRKIKININHGAALVSACERLDFDVVWMLLQADGIDPNAGRGAALITACKLNDSDIVLALLGHRHIDANIKNGAPLITAARYGNTDVVRHLLHEDVGLDVNIQDCKALIKACTYGHDGVVDVLLASGRIDLALYGSRAVRVAVRFGYTSIVEVLLGTGEVEVANDLPYLACTAGHSDRLVSGMMRVLLNKRPLDSQVQRQGVGLLAMAVMRNYIATVALLLGEGDIDVNMNMGEPLHLACVYRRIEIIRMLVAHGAIDVYASKISANLHIYQDDVQAIIFKAATG